MILDQLEKWRRELLVQNRTLPLCQFILTPQDYAELLRETVGDARGCVNTYTYSKPTIFGIPFAVHPSRTFLRVL